VTRLASLILAVSLLAASAEEAPESDRQNDVVFVYLHGFGGAKKRPRFCANLQEFLDDAELSNRIINYEWDSVRIEVLQAGASWLDAEKRADEDAVKFKLTVLDRLEREQTPYVLIGFSIGSRVLLGALDNSNGKLDMLRGVYFLGSAMTRDTTLDRARLPRDMKIFNYYSPRWDIVHQTSFNFMNRVAAGGLRGFTDTEVFENYAVSCTHTHKGVGVHIDYSQLAVAIAYMTLYKEGIVLEGRAGINLETSVGEGELWWNKVWRVPCRIDGTLETVEIEQNNVVAEYFRALLIKPDGDRKRIARGSNMHAVLKEINAVQPDRATVNREAHE
jgi:pimeloyl-ACP methyl ester carboxylesterase